MVISAPFRRFLITLLFLTTINITWANDPIRIASLHPILSDIAKRIGGEHVVVISLLKPNGNLHAFEPDAEQLRLATKSNIILASGKNLEPYLHKLHNSLGEKNRIIDVGATIPDVILSDNDAKATCCSPHGPQEQEKHEHCTHQHNTTPQAIDPHWWHSLDNINKASFVIMAALIKERPELAPVFQKNRLTIEAECKKLKGWAKYILLSIPQEQRILITGHAAFGHLCQELGFKQIALQGIAREDEGTSSRLAETLKTIRQLNIMIVFPEYQSNPKVIEEITKTTKARMGDALVSDGTAPQAHTFDTMYRHNVNAIAKALCPQETLIPLQ